MKNLFAWAGVTSVFLGFVGYIYEFLFLTIASLGFALLFFILMIAINE